MIINTNKKTRIVILRNNDSTFNDVLLEHHYLIQDTFNYVRENVRLYNYCGLVTTVYFVLNLVTCHKKRLLRVVWLSD